MAGDRRASTTSARASARRKVTALRVLVGLAVVLAFAGWWVWLRPAVLGGPLSLVTVSGTSMQPTMWTGDLAVMHKTDRYERGDVVAYHVRLPDGDKGGVVIHRIVGGDAGSGFRTRGDNDEWVDPWRPRPADILGELWLHVPRAGGFVLWLSRPVIIAGFCAALAAFLVVVQGGGARADSSSGAASEREAAK